MPEKIEGYIESHPGAFSIVGLSKILGFSEEICREVAESHPWVVTLSDEMVNKPGPQARYRSMAALQTTLDGYIEENNMVNEYKDELGREARADFYELIRVRRLCLHQGKIQRKWHR